MFTTGALKLQKASAHHWRVTTANIDQPTAEDPAAAICALGKRDTYY
jgi:hypothetical protein